MADSVSSTSSSSSSTSTSGGLLQTLGLGSGLDISSLVEELTAAQMNGPNSRIERAQESVTTSLSALSTLKSALSTFQTSLTSLLTGGGFSARKVTSGDEDVFTATATASAALATYTVEVEQLAQPQQLLSTNFTGGADTTLGVGTLSFTVGGKSFNVEIDGDHTTLEGVRDAINEDSDNSSVSATLVYGVNGAQLVLTSQSTGADSAITVATSGSTALSQLAYSTTNTANYTELQSAQDAIVWVSGVEHHSASNTVDDAIDGVTLTLLGTNDGSAASLKVANDTDSVVSLVKSFVEAYNTLQEATAELDSYDSSTGESGALFGDSMYAGLKRQMRQVLASAVEGASDKYSTLASLGITISVDGEMSLDETKIKSALSADFSSVSRVFSGADGIVASLNRQITTALLSGGAIASRTETLNERQDSIDKEKDMIEVRTAKIKERYLAKFNAMDNLLAQLQNTADFLTQQFDALNKSSDS